MAINKVVYGENTLIDLSGDDVTENDVVEGVTVHTADGNTVTGKLKFYVDTIAERDALTVSAGMTVYVKEDKKYYLYNGTKWEEISISLETQNDSKILIATMSYIDKKYTLDYTFEEVKSAHESGKTVIINGNNMTHFIYTVSDSYIRFKSIRAGGCEAKTMAIYDYKLLTDNTIISTNHTNYSVFNYDYVFDKDYVYDSNELSNARSKSFLYYTSNKAKIMPSSSSYLMSGSPYFSIKKLSKDSSDLIDVLGVNLTSLVFPVIGYYCGQKTTESDGALKIFHITDAERNEYNFYIGSKAPHSLERLLSITDIPQPTSEDSGKVLGVNVDGNYELVESASADLTGYATQEWVNQQGFSKTDNDTKYTQGNGIVISTDNQISVDLDSIATSIINKIELADTKEVF